MNKSFNDCDQVFDVLTRGPFPSGDSTDTQVERHLTICHECRCLAEALRPSVDLFHESLDEYHRGELPAYRPRQTVVGVSTIQRNVMHSICSLPEQVRSARPLAARSGFIDRSFPIIVASVALFTMAILFVRPWQSTASTGAAIPPVRPTESTQESLAALDLPMVCSSLDETRRPMVALRKYDCCTRCHRAASPRTRSHPSVSVLIGACGTCHRQLSQAGNDSHGGMPFATLVAI